MSNEVANPYKEPNNEAERKRINEQFEKEGEWESLNAMQEKIEACTRRMYESNTLPKGPMSIPKSIKTELQKDEEYQEYWSRLVIDRAAIDHGIHRSLPDEDKIKQIFEKYSLDNLKSDKGK